MESPTQDIEYLTMRLCKMLIILFVLCTINYSICLPYLNEIGNSWYHFKYSAFDSEREESGEFVQKESGQVWVVRGYYFYKIGNVAYNVSYIADDNGYRATQTRIPLSTKTSLVLSDVDDLSADIANRIGSNVLASLAGGGLG
ncbi:unnamed protein product [Ceutorhynchus assimilis]|uniref:Uncharacterized protein n=1 Tax=Ceutorhynchus assimilis TaxID=467358 RepID=A0A9N9MXD2_9CUCU|nr:unnamed protein product [Ceutorhynchus assimilis]